METLLEGNRISRDTFITKQILNSRVRKQARPHKKQIITEIETAIDDERFQMCRYVMPKSSKSVKRPKTAHSVLRNIHNEDNQSINFVKKMSFKFDQIDKISSLFDKRFEMKKIHLKQKTPFSKQVSQIRKTIAHKQKERKQMAWKNKRSFHGKTQPNNQNIYLGFPKQKVKKTIPIARAKNQDTLMLTRCIKGGYVQDADSYSKAINKTALLKMKKKFVTFNTLYEGVKGKRGKKLLEISPNKIENNKFINLVYYLENQRQMKASEKRQLEKKLNILE